MIDLLLKNRFESITFDSIDLATTLTDAIEQFRIRKVTVTSPGYEDANVSELTVPKGPQIDLEVTLRGSKQQTNVAHLSLTAPRRPGYGTIAIGGGADVPRARADDFDSLLAAWAGARRNDEVVARLLYGPKTRQKGLTSSYSMDW